MLNKVKHLYTDSSLTLRMTGSVNMYIVVRTPAGEPQRKLTVR